MILGHLDWIHRQSGYFRIIRFFPMYNRPDKRRIPASQVVQFGTGLADPGHGLVMLPIMCGAVWTGFVLARENLFRLLKTVIS